MNRPRTGYLPALVILALTACSQVAGAGAQEAVPATPSVLVATSTPVNWFPAFATPTLGAEPASQPTPEKKPGIGQVLLSDDFSSPDEWNTAVSDQAAVVIAEKALTIATQPGIAPVASFRQGQIFGNMYAEITARPSLCRDADDYGLAFRAPNNIAYYRFAVACNGTAGAQRFSLGAARILHPAILSADVPTGAPGEVRLGVWAVGSEFRFFLNDRYQFTATDSSYASGAIGVFAHAGGDSPVTVTFADLVVYAVGEAIPATQPPP
jgi:hypothetical protein